MSDKIDLNALRKIVEQSLRGMSFEEEAPEQVDMFPGSHSASEEEYDDYYGEEEGETGRSAEMLKQNLFQLSVYAAKLHDMIQSHDQVEEWMEEKIVQATTEIADVYHSIEYKAFRDSE